MVAGSSAGLLPDDADLGWPSFPFAKHVLFARYSVGLDMSHAWGVAHSGLSLPSRPIATEGPNSLLQHFAWNGQPATPTALPSRLPEAAHKPQWSVLARPAPKWTRQSTVSSHGQLDVWCLEHGDTGGFAMCDSM